MGRSEIVSVALVRPVTGRPTPRSDTASRVGVSNDDRGIFVLLASSNIIKRDHVGKGQSIREVRHMRFPVRWYLCHLESAAPEFDAYLAGTAAVLGRDIPPESSCQGLLPSVIKRVRRFMPGNVGHGRRRRRPHRARRSRCGSTLEPGYS